MHLRYNRKKLPAPGPRVCPLASEFPGDIDLAEEKLYSATYVGSGTFIISKPKRKRAKLRQSRVKSPQRGARK
jgi:hypothetical protein